MPRTQNRNQSQNMGIPPHDIDAEKSVLGALLIDKDAIVRVVEFLRPKDFYQDTHKNIFEAILSLYEKREPADIVTVQNELKKLKALKRVGGVTYLSELVNAVPTAANVEYYAKLIHADAQKRHLLTVAGDIGTMVFQEPEIETLLDKSEQLLFSVSQDAGGRDIKHAKEILEVTFDQMDELSRTKGKLRGIPTHMKRLNKLTNGFKPGELVILAARPSVGKSSLAFNIAEHASIKHGKTILIFSLEMGGESIMNRMISSVGDIDNWKIETGNLDDSDHEKYMMASGELSEANIYIDDTPGASVLEMRTKARRLAMEEKIDLIIVDYMQLIRAPNAESRVQEVSKISQALKNLARELNLPVMALSQLSRAVEQRGGDKRPQLSDLRDSGSIEQDADMVMFLYRPDEDVRDELQLVLAKNRNGATGDLDLFFKGDRTKFFERVRAAAPDEN